MKSFAWILVFISVVAKAQTSCPNLFSHNSEKITAPITMYTAIQGGITQSFLYSNSGACLNSNYSFISTPKPYVGFNLIASLSDRWELSAGTQFAQNKQGMLFKYKKNGDKIFERLYNTSVLFRFPLGIFYNASTHWKIGVSPAILFSTFFETRYSGAYSINPGTTIVSYDYAWHIPNGYDIWYLATDFLIRYKINRRMAAQVALSMDYTHTVPAHGEATIQYSDRQESLFHGSLNPYLCYLGIGMAYTLSKKYIHQLGD